MSSVPQVPAPGAGKRNRSLLERVRAGRIRALTGAGDKGQPPGFLRAA
jgi:hypothetical protein